MMRRHEHSDQCACFYYGLAVVVLHLKLTSHVCGKLLVMLHVCLAVDGDFEKKIVWLLDAIKHIKQQKQRPDRERICHYVQQHQNVSPAEVALLLDKCVKCGLMTTAITRGNTDKLTYIVSSDSSYTQTVTKKGSSKAKPAVSNCTSNTVPANTPPPPPAPPQSEKDGKRIIHDKSDISPLMVTAVKGMISKHYTCSIGILYRPSILLLGATYLLVCRTRNCLCSLSQAAYIACVTDLFFFYGSVIQWSISGVSQCWCKFISLLTRTILA